MRETFAKAVPGSVMSADYLQRLSRVARDLSGGAVANIHRFGNGNFGVPEPFAQRLVIYEPESSDAGSVSTGLVSIKLRYWNAVTSLWATDDDVEYDLDLDSVGGMTLNDGDILTAWWEPMRGAFIPVVDRLNGAIWAYKNSAIQTIAAGGTTATITLGTKIHRNPDDVNFISGTTEAIMQRPCVVDISWAVPAYSSGTAADFHYIYVWLEVNGVAVDGTAREKYIESGLHAVHFEGTIQQIVAAGDVIRLRAHNPSYSLTAFINDGSTYAIGALAGGGARLDIAFRRYV